MGNLNVNSVLRDEIQQGQELDTKLQEILRCMCRVCGVPTGKD